MSGTVAKLLAMLVLGAGGPADDPRDEPQAALARLGDAQLVGQRIVAGFDGRTPPNSLRRRIRGGRLAGVILFADNFGSRAGAERLARELQAIRRPRGLRAPLLVMIDQEGGVVKRLPGPPDLSAEQMGAAGPDTCRRQGAATGRLLRRTAINVDLAPVLDLATPGGAIAREQRSFGGDPRRVSSCAGAFAAALQRAGVAPTAKHFPGLGRARINTDDALQRIDASRAELRRSDEVPFREFVEGGARGRLVMLSSAIYEAFAERPAAFTARLATGELRGRLGFEGVSITDALETASTQSFGGPTRAARFAARAGTDLMLFAELGSARQAAKALRGVLRRERGRFEASVRRVLDLRSDLPG